MSAQNRFGIVVGGGPAPGINGVIGAATQHALASGYEVLGIRDGFSWLMQGDAEHASPLVASEVSRIHLRGGSVLGIARANPTKDPAKLDRTLTTLSSLGVDKLITIGGDDTAFSAHMLAERSGGKIRVVHVPKTIDNDLDLPGETSTFGFQTARHVGVEIVKNLLADAETTKRWYIVVAMGRKAGHLALGIGKAAGATLTVIGEEYAGQRLSLGRLVDTVVGTIVKRAAQNTPYGVVVLAEGLVELLDPEELARIGNVERDDHGHIRIAEIPFADIVKTQTQARLARMGHACTIVGKNVGYELRCADPIAFDMEYTRELGYAAAQLLIDGGSGAMVSMLDGKLTPMPFASILDASTGRMRVRMVNVRSDRFRVAQAFMTRISERDFENATTLRSLAATTNLSPEAFTRELKGALG